MTRASGEAYRNIRLCIDSYENGVTTGQFYFPALDQEGRPFVSLIQFLVEAENALDEVGFPQSYTAKRSFASHSQGVGKETGVAMIRSGRLATFELRLLFRQHASWQGTVKWIEGKEELSFRSVLELILLMNSALESNDG